ncbi:MAG: hypothetical protein JOZ27_03465, partial [Caulobacteraceae bacterium]|nr:hypothetical protein [Caulobacteraceae bacterium]
MAEAIRFLGNDTTDTGASRQGAVAVSATNPLPVSGSFSASAFQPAGQTSLAASTTSANAALVGGGSTVVVYNPGTVPAYVQFGGSSVAATVAGGFPIPAGAMVALAVTSATYIAAITASGATTLAIATGSGIPAVAEGGALTFSDPAEGTPGAAAPAKAIQVGGVDGSGNLQSFTAAILHTSDNQSFGGSARGILTGGVAQ